MARCDCGACVEFKSEEQQANRRLKYFEPPNTLLIMKSSENPASQSWLWPIVIAVCALGAGITGTLLVVQNRTPTANNSTSLQPLPAAPETTVAAPAPMTSPPSTAGMSPGESALALGNWHFDHKEWRPAIAQYKIALASGLDTADVRTDLGSAYRFAGDAKQALAQYELAQKKSSQHENSLFNQGGVYAFDLKQPKRGIAVWRTYLQRFPHGAMVKSARQFIREAGGK